MEKEAIATFGAGCFWCVEAVFQELKGVTAVRSGYMGGHTQNPTYEQVCSGTTGHAEVARIHFDPTQISYRDLLSVFWQTHDPTTIDRQGGDIGDQYRSVVFTHSAEQLHEARQMLHELDRSGAYPAPIVTLVQEASTFFPAEQYHHDYYARNGNQGYCRNVIRPKMEKFRKVFSDKL